MEAKAAGRPAVLERLASIRRGLLLFIAAGVPLAYLPGLTNDPYYVPKTSLLLIGTALAGILKIVELALGGSARGLRRVVVPAIGLGLPLLVAWLASPYRNWEVWGSYRRLLGLAPSLVVIVFGVLLCDAFRGKGRARALAWTLASSGGLVSIYALVQMFGFDPFLDIIPADYVPSTVGYSNFLGGFLAVCLPACLGLWALGGRERCLAQVLTVLVATALIGSFSQGGWGAAVAGVAVFAGMSLSGRWPRSRTVGVVAAGLIAGLMVGPVVLSLYNGGSGFVGGSIATRGLHWETAVDVFVDHPWIGRGPSAFLLEGPGYRSPLESMWLDQSLADDPHSVPLATLVNAGALGALGYLIALGWILKRARLVRPSPLAAAALGSLGAYLAQSLVSIDVITLRVSFWVCLAGLVAMGAEVAEPVRATIRRQGVPLRRRVATAGLGVVALSLCLMAGVAGLRLLVADHRVYEGTEAVGDGRTYDAIGDFEAATSLSSMGHYRRVLGDELTVASLDEAAKLRPELLGSVLEAYGEISQTPDLQWITAYAQQMNQWSMYTPDLATDSLIAYRRAQRLDPHSVFVGVRIADLQLREGDSSGALRTLQPYVEATRATPDFIRDYPEVWGALAIAQWQEGDIAAAREAIATAYAMDPAECHVLIARGMLGSAFPEGRLSNGSLDMSISLACDAPTASLTELERTPHSEPSLLVAP